LQNFLQKEHLECLSTLIDCGIDKVEDLYLLNDDLWNDMNLPSLDRKKIRSALDPQRSQLENFLQNLELTHCLSTLIEFGVNKVEDIYDLTENLWTDLKLRPLEKHKIQNKLFPNNRFLEDQVNEISDIESPVDMWLNGPVPSFDNAIENLKPEFKKKEEEIESLAIRCKKFAIILDKNKKNSLSNDSIQAIHLYTMELTPKEKSLYYLLNKALRDQDRDTLTPYAPYIHLLLHSLCLLPENTGTLLWRGVKGDLHKNYTKGKRIIWWGFSSCTKNRILLRSLWETKMRREPCLIFKPVLQEKFLSIQHSQKKKNSSFSLG